MTRSAVMLAAGFLAVLAIRATSLSAASPASAAAAMETTLRDYAFHGTLANALLDLQRQAGTSIDADWRALEAAGVTRDRPVSLAAAQSSVGQILDALLARAARPGAPLGWFADQNRICVTTQQAAIQRIGPAPAPPAGAERSAPRPAAAPASQPAPPVEARHAIVQPQPLEIVFENAPLSDVLNYIRDTGRVNMHINWASLSAVGIDKDTRVSINVKGVSLAKAMDLIFDDLNANKNRYDSIYWFIDDGVVLVASGTALDSQMRTKVMDVADLLAVVPDYTSPELNLTSNGTDNGNNTQTTNTDSGAQGNRELTQTQKENVAKALTAAIIHSIGEEMWQPVGKGSIHYIGGNMVMSQSLLGFKLMEKAMR